MFNLSLRITNQYKKFKLNFQSEKLYVNNQQPTIYYFRINEFSPN